MKNRIVTLLLLAGLLFAVLALVPRLGALRLPDNNRDYQPQQPVAFSHRLHAGELQVDCRYCHSGVKRSRHAGIPAINVCMNCHEFVTATRAQVRASELEAKAKGAPAPTRVLSPEIAKLYRALGRNEEGVQAFAPEPIEWIRIHSLPDFVAFDHRPHEAAGVPCQKCHGPIETMERVRQAEALSMGFCVNCHRSSLVTSEVRPRSLEQGATDDLAVSDMAVPDRVVGDPATSVDLVNTEKPAADLPHQITGPASTDCSKCHY